MIKKVKELLGLGKPVHDIISSRLDPSAKKELIERWMLTKGLKGSGHRFDKIIAGIIVTSLTFILISNPNRMWSALGIASLCGVATYSILHKLFTQHEDVDIILGSMKKRIELKKIVGKMYKIYKSVFFKYFEHFDKGIKNGNPTLALMRFKQYPKSVKQIDCVNDEKCQKFYDIIKKMRFRPNYREKTVQHEDIERAKDVLNELVEEFKGDLIRDDI